MSYFNRRTNRPDDRSPRSHQPSGHERLGAPPSFAPLNAPSQPDMGQQQQSHQSMQPGFPPQGPMGHGRGGGFIPPPPGHAQGSPRAQCYRCKYSFSSQEELDQHAFACGAAALVTGFLTPYPAQPQQPQQQQQHQPHSQTPHGSGGYHQHQHQTQNQNPHYHPDRAGYDYQRR